MLPISENKNIHKLYIMHYAFESIFVALYSTIIYIILSIFIDNIYFLYFSVGFFKHFLGYFLKIQDYYCSYGYACNHNSDYTVNIKNSEIFLESAFEGIIFLLLSAFLLLFIKNKIIVIFLIGLLLHIVYELSGIHKLFCKYRCKKIIKN